MVSSKDTSVDIAEAKIQRLEYMLKHTTDKLARETLKQWIRIQKTSKK